MFVPKRSQKFSVYQHLRQLDMLQEYMSKWNGQVFVDSMKFDDTKKVLEIGVGTGRLAAKVVVYL